MSLVRKEAEIDVVLSPNRADPDHPPTYLLHLPEGDIQIGVAEDHMIPPLPLHHHPDGILPLEESETHLPLPLSLAYSPRSAMDSIIIEHEQN